MMRSCTSCTKSGPCMHAPPTALVSLIALGARGVGVHYCTDLWQQKAQCAALSCPSASFLTDMQAACLAHPLTLMLHAACRQVIQGACELADVPSSSAAPNVSNQSPKPGLPCKRRLLHRLRGRLAGVLPAVRVSPSAESQNPKRDVATQARTHTSTSCRAGIRSSCRSCLTLTYTKIPRK